METRAYIAEETDDQLRVTVRENCTLYNEGNAVPGMSWTYPLVDGGRVPLFGAQPDQPFADADQTLAEHGWTREGRWLVGDAITGTYARIVRA